MDDIIKSICDKLKSAGVDAGGRVAVCSENSELFTAVVVGCWGIGAVVVPLSVRYSAGQLKSVVGDLSCDIVFMGGAFAYLDLHIDTFIIDDVLGGVGLDEGIRFSDLDLDLDAEASVILTSGSTGTPKGVLHTVGNHYYSAVGSCENIPFGNGDCWAISLPMYHISGLSVVMRSLVGGGSIYYPAAGETLEEIVMHKEITHISLVGTQLMRLLDRADCVGRLRDYSAILVGGSAIPAGLIEKALAGALPIYTTYGSSETASQLFTASPADLSKDANTSGRLLNYRKAKIADDGEILAGGKTLFKGYAGGGGVISAADGDGWFHTGDVGWMDDDGLLFVSGRKDRMFISGGENIYPEEIEKAIEGIDGVEKAVVKPVDDERFGKRPVAYVKMRKNVPLMPDMIKEELRGKLEGFKVPEVLLHDN